MAITRHDYSAEAVAAARSVLLELAHLLGAYGDDIVVVGGWGADFDEITDPEERARVQRDAYERVNYLLRRLGMT